MSNGAPPEPESTNTKQRRQIWKTTGLTLGAIAILGAAGGTLAAWIFVNERLSPWASELLTEALDRPVYLGEVKRVSLTGVRFGQSALPATADDPDQLVVETLSIRLNLLQLLTRTLRPRITVENPVVYVEQNAQGEWLDIDFDFDDEDDEDDDEDREPLIRISPVVAILNGELTVVPYSEPPATASPLNINAITGSVEVAQVKTADFSDQDTLVKAQTITLDVSAEPENAGMLEVIGVIQQPEVDEEDDAASAIAANLAIQAQSLDLGILSPVLLASLPQALPFEVPSGILNGNLEVNIAPETETSLTGTASLRDGVIAFDAMTMPFTNINTQAQFRDNGVRLDEITASFGEMSAVAAGTIDARNGYDLTGEIFPVALADIAAAFDFEPPIPAEGTLKAEVVEITGPLAQPLIAGNILSTDVVTLDKVQFANMATRLSYSAAGLAFANLSLEPLAGGSLTGEGALSFGRPATLALQLTGQDLPADAIGQAYGLPDTVVIGPVALEADINGPVNDLSGLVTWDAPAGTYPTNGTAEIAANTLVVRNAAIAGGTASGTATLNAGQWTADVAAQGLQLGVFNRSLEGVVGGGDVRLAGSTADFSLRGIRGDGDITAALLGGTFNSQVALANGTWTADITTRDFPVGQFAANVPVDRINADARLSGSVDDFSLAALQGEGTVAAAIAGGTVTSDFRLANGAWQADGQGNGLQLGQFSTALQGTGDATFQLAGNLDELTPAGVRGRANIRLSDGLATLAGTNAALAQSRSPLDASLAWDGRQLQIESLETAGLFASGTVTPQFTGPNAPSIAAIDLGLIAENYDLATLPVTLPPVLGLEGQADFQGRLTGTPSNLNFAGDLALANLALNDLVFEPLLAGDVNFSSQNGLVVSLLGVEDEISVTFDPQPRQLDVTVRAGESVAIATTEGDLLQAQLYSFPISALNLPPADSEYGSLRGQVEFANATVNLNDFSTTGQFDIQNLGIGFYSVDRLFGGFSYADGVARLANGQILMADRDVRGEAIATRTYDVSGRYSLNQSPQLQATLSTEAGELRDVLEVLKIQELADFRRGFTPNEGFIPKSPEEAEAILATTSAGDPNGTLLDQLRRLSEIMELEVQEEIQASQSTIPPLSELQGAFNGVVDISADLPEDLRVTFDLNGQAWRWGPDISADVVLAQGGYRNGLITLAPLQFSSQGETADSSVSFAGEFSLDPADNENRLMTVEVANVPSRQLEDLANLPFTLTGDVNGTAELRGRLSAPNLSGQLQIADGTLNGAPIEQVEATFAYVNARAGLDAELLLVGADDPLTLSARLPYQLGFVEQPPTDTSYRLVANVKDEGFALLNLFTRQVAWESGEGTMILDLEGDTAQNNGIPSEFQGLVTLNGATISSSTLPVPMTDITGRIRLSPANLGSIVVEDLTGQFSEGQLMAEGVFPLFVPLPSQATESAPETADSPAAEPVETTDTPPTEDALESEDTSETADAAESEDGDGSSDQVPDSFDARPLTLDLENIALNLKGLYNGQVNGEMQLLGSLLAGPVLSGEIDLTRGTITIPEGNNAVAVTPSTSDRSTGESFLPPFRFDNLRLVLARNINIVQGNLLDVTARGGLRLDGTIDNLRPTGTIQLPSGRVGIFTVALRLAGDNDRAEFRGNFDPILDVTLQTSLPDASSFSEGIGVTTSPFPQNEVSDNTLNEIGLTQQGNSLVRINARYTGTASELADLTTDSRNLELTSSPARSQQEIVSLLSGNVIGALDALGNSDDALAGLGTFLGSALLSNVRDFLGDTVPLSEFRIFQVTESSGGVNDSEDIGGEIGFDVTSNISVSVLKVLTNDTPFQFNTRYRLSDQFTLRGTTSYEDFSDRTGVLLEYETRF
ncbi:MAG: translocation/assembly module TamB domain-containing protein [Leptolyngbyaceae cyanobacterium]